MSVMSGCEGETLSRMHEKRAEPEGPARCDQARYQSQNQSCQKMLSSYTCMALSLHVV